MSERIKTDVLVVGGGITGLGVALEASRWGFDTLVCERDTLCAHTSGNSLRIIHGGLRYLQHGNLRRVFESSREQTHWLSHAARFIRPLECVIPLSKWGMKSAPLASLAAMAYSAVLSTVSSPLRAPKVLATEAGERRAPSLKGQIPHGVLQWHDALLEDPKGFALYLAETVRSTGGVLLENARVGNITRRGSGWSAELADGRRVESSVIVNASGPWFEDIIPEPLRRLIIPVPQKWCAALNIEFNFERERDVAVGMASRSGRMFFLVPRGRSGAKYNCVAGTWYFPIKANERGEGYQQQTELFLTELRETFADDRMNAQNIASIDQGILPMARETASGPEPLGRHLITEVDGIVNIVSTKYTTFRLVGAEALQAAKRTLKRSPFC